MALIEKLRSPIRAGLIDTWAWGASMLVGATYDEWDIPVCPTSISVIPNHVITWTNSKPAEMRLPGVTTFMGSTATP